MYCQLIKLSCTQHFHCNLSGHRPHKNNVENSKTVKFIGLELSPVPIHLILQENKLVVSYQEYTHNQQIQCNFICCSRSHFKLHFVDLKRQRLPIEKIHELRPTILTTVLPENFLCPAYKLYNTVDERSIRCVTFLFGDFPEVDRTALADALSTSSSANAPKSRE